MDFRTMLMELLMGQAQPGGGMMPPKMTDRLWAGGPTMDMGPGGAPLMPNDSPIMSRGGPVPGASAMPKSMGIPMGPQSTPPSPPPPMQGLPPGFGMSQAQLPQEMGAMTPGSPGPLGFMPPQNPMGLGQPQAPAQAPMPQLPPPGQQQMASAGGGLRGLFGGPGRTLYDIFSDAMAGVAAADPTKPGLTAFAQGATGARASKKLRETDKTKSEQDAEDRLWKREGEELDREGKRLELKDAPRMSRVKYLEALAKISESLDKNSPEQFRRDLIGKAAEGGLLPEESDIDRAVKMAFPQGKAGEGSGAGKIAKDPQGNYHKWDGSKWVPLDPSEIPMM